MAALRLGNREVVPATTDGPLNVFTQKPFTLVKRRFVSSFHLQFSSSYLLFLLNTVKDTSSSSSMKTLIQHNAQTILRLWGSQCLSGVTVPRLSFSCRGNFISVYFKQVFCRKHIILWQPMSNIQSKEKQSCTAQCLKYLQKINLEI